MCVCSGQQIDTYSIECTLACLLAPYQKASSKEATHTMLSQMLSENLGRTRC
jgi:hypothetical protein